MFTRLRRWLFEKANSLRDWINSFDICELCHEEVVDLSCVGCKRRICMDCESGYYEDESLCKKCRSDITPEDEEQDRKDQLELEEDAK